jgi:hypothetical protein
VQSDDNAIKQEFQASAEAIEVASVERATPSRTAGFQPAPFLPAHQRKLNSSKGRIHRVGAHAVPLAANDATLLGNHQVVALTEEATLASKLIDSEPGW